MKSFSLDVIKSKSKSSPKSWIRSWLRPPREVPFGGPPQGSQLSLPFPKSKIVSHRVVILDNKGNLLGILERGPLHLHEAIQVRNKFRSQVDWKNTFLEIQALILHFDGKESWVNTSLNEYKMRIEKIGPFGPYETSQIVERETLKG